MEPQAIKKITELDNFALNKKGSYGTYQGFEVETEKQRIYVLVDNQSQCCEDWGHISSHGDMSDFIGAKLLKVDVVDTALKKAEWDSRFEYGLDGGDAMFVNFETDRGTFQLTVYCSHNGYYGHEAILVCQDIIGRKHL